MRRTFNALAGASLLMTLVAAGTASAREYQFQFGVSESEVLSDSFVIATGSSTSMTPDFGFAVEVGAHVFVGVHLAGLSSASGESTLLGSSSDASTFDLGATARWQYPVYSWLTPIVEGAIGTSRVRLQMAGDIQTAWTALVEGRVGVGFRSTPGALVGTLVVGVDLLVGYTWRSGAEFQSGGVDLGTLDIHGTTARVGLVLAF